MRSPRGVLLVLPARLFSPLGVFLALVCAAGLAAGSATASSAAQSQAAAQGPLPVPNAFRLSASNGYTLNVIAVPPRADRSGSLLIFASSKGRGVHYVAPATVTETSIQAHLGELGEISVSFQRSNQATTVPCGKKKIRFDSGHYEGKIDFHGEQGYTSVEATSVPGNIDFVLSVVCGETTFFGEATLGRPPGAALHVRNPGLGPGLSVRKSRPGAAARITAWTSESTNGISIQRFATLRMPGEDFRYDRRLQTATVHPPRPFAGSARFDRGKKAGRRWSGDLTVDLPGRAGVPLTGPALRATLAPSG